MFSTQTSHRLVSLRKAGFAYEGLLRKHRRKDNQFINSKLYALVT